MTFGEETPSMSVAEEDLEELSCFFDLDEEVPVLLLLMLLRWEGEDVVEDGGG